MNSCRVLQLLMLTCCAAIPVDVLGQKALPRAEATAADKAESIGEIEICDLFRRLDAFDGKHVAVRGVYRFSTELAGLYSEGCQKPLLNPA